MMQHSVIDAHGAVEVMEQPPPPESTGGPPVSIMPPLSKPPPEEDDDEPLLLPELPPLLDALPEELPLAESICCDVSIMPPPPPSSPPPKPPPLLAPFAHASGTTAQDTTSIAARVLVIPMADILRPDARRSEEFAPAQRRALEVRAAQVFFASSAIRQIQRQTKAFTTAHTRARKGPPT
jgi:hypothetical protein